MKLNIGDKVSFLNEKGEGVVSKLINTTTVVVTIEDGFEIPYLISELILISEQPPIGTPMEMEVKTADKMKVPISKKNYNKETEGIYVAFSPERADDVSHSDFNVWFINYTNYRVLFTYSIFINGQFKTITMGDAIAGEQLLIETIDKKLLHDYSNFKIDVLFYDVENHEYQKPASEIIKLKPIKLYKENAFVDNAFISDKALIMQVILFSNNDASILNVDVSKITFQKQEKSSSQKISKPHISNDPTREMEIDLHIEELLDNYYGMSNFEIVQVQLNTFQKALDKAISEHYRKLIVIHGVGNGRLKQEVRAILATYSNLRFHDASYAKYGFGATEVELT